MISFCSTSISFSHWVFVRDSPSNSNALWGIALPLLLLLFLPSLGRSVSPPLDVVRVACLLIVSFAAFSSCCAVSRTLLVGFATRLGRFGVEKGVSCSIVSRPSTLSPCVSPVSKWNMSAGGKP
ncbi:hypothetical protein BKA56DRAFT_604130 [Ilyonectria sp. MPI-CAGE-AT-0026]|nr:hypothetical protein BKA56DRAFT_604130 [Ilyonectria sp. MPI-CAGE-AT-0026]